MDTDMNEELLSAALDGEAVDVAALQEMLRRPEARETLAAFVLLRAAACADGFSESASSLTPSAGRSATPSQRGRRRVPLTLAASIAALAVAGSFWLGASWRHAPPAVVRPALTQGTGSSEAGGSAGRERAGLEEPPVPTRRDKFVPGVDWHAGS